ncbi:MAG: hypothetical protein M3Y08_13705 [Fibrobacterota bacterium]|nr:hypothetical protein [Fibrobacterota bacterium]
MKQRITGLTIGAFALAMVSTAWAGSGNPVPGAALPATAVSKAPFAAPAKASKPKNSPAPESRTGGLAAPGNLQGTSAPGTEAVSVAPKPILADAFIAQNVLRVFLNRPAAIFVFNSRGQQVFHLDSRRPLEAVPLQGISTGFVYLTVRTAQGEMTKKLVYTGK